jgi:hypothetical protein
MIPDKSFVVRRLTAQELEDLHEELERNSNFFMKHPMKNTALYEGDSIVINWVTKINGTYQLQWTIKEKFPKTWRLLEEVAQGRALAKVYWHRLNPGTVATPHTDLTNCYIADGDLDHRYNIMLDVPTDLVYRVDDSNEPLDNEEIANTLYDLSTIKMHSADNNSNEPFYCMIIDVLKPGVAVDQDLYQINNFYSVRIFNPELPIVRSPLER